MRGVLVTGTGGTGVGASIVHALRQAHRWRILAVDADPFSWGLYTADQGRLVPRADHPGYLDAIRDLIKEHDICAVIPGTEAEVVLLAEHRDDLPVPVIANREELMPLMRDKRQAQDKLRELGLPWIPSFPWRLRSQAVIEFGYPLVVKPSRESSGSRGLFLVTSRRELDSLEPWVTADSDVQPYVGDAGHEYSVTVLSTTEGQVIDSFAVRRELTGFTLHTSREFYGSRIAVSTPFTQGYVIRDSQIQGFAEDLAVLLDSRGPLDIQLRLSRGKPHVFEIQPRFSFSASFRAACGFNEPDILLRHWLDGEQPSRAGYRADVAVMRSFDHVIVPLGEMLEGAGG